MKVPEEFYNNTLDSDKAMKFMHEMYSQLTFKECMWIFRNMCYEAWSNRLTDGSYTDEQQEQATQLKYSISANTDLFTQLISGRNSFNREYLKQYEVAGPHLLRISDLEGQIENLESKIQELYNEF